MLVLLTVISHVFQITNGGISIDNPHTCAENRVNSFNHKTGIRKCLNSPMGGLKSLTEGLNSPMEDEADHLPVTCKNSKVDIGFILGSSSGMRTDYQNEKKFLKFVAAAFGVTDSRVGVISFDNRTFHNIRLNENVNSSSFNAAVDAISLISSSSRRNKALRFAQEEFFTTRHGARNGASKLLILLTNDSHMEGTESDELEELAKRDVRVIVVSTGSRDNATELIRVAGSIENVFHAESFEQHLRSNVAEAIVGKYCRKTNAPEWPWVKQELIGNQTPITSNNTIAILEEVELEYKVILQFWPSSVPKGWGNVIHFTTGGNNENKYGDRMPAVYYHGTDKEIEISSAVSGNAFFYKHISSVSSNTWHTVEITQEKEALAYYYSVVVNGNSIVRVVNNRPQVFYNVSVFASDPWYTVQNGFIRILNFYRKEIAFQASASMRMPAKIKDKDKEAYTRTAGVVISVGFLAMIGAGFL